MFNRGTNIPLEEEETSNTAEGSGVVVPIPTLFWAFKKLGRLKVKRISCTTFFMFYCLVKIGHNGLKITFIFDKSGRKYEIFWN